MKRNTFYAVVVLVAIGVAALVAWGQQHAQRKPCPKGNVCLVGVTGVPVETGCDGFCITSLLTHRWASELPKEWSVSLPYAAKNYRIDSVCYAGHCPESYDELMQLDFCLDHGETRVIRAQQKTAGEK